MIILRQIIALLLSKSIIFNNIYQHPRVVSCFKYTPTSGVGVEQLLIIFKNMLTKTSQPH